MRTIFLLSLFTFLPALLVSQNPNPDPQMDQELLSLMQNERLPGLSTVIVKDGEIIWIESYGWSDFTDLSLVQDSTAFLLASISKTYTATALLQLWESGNFGLDEPVSNYLPFAVTHPNHPNTPITFRMLLTHTSGIRDNWNVMDQYYTIGDPVVALGDFLESLLSENGSNYDANDNFYPNQPGTNYKYSNIGASLCGYLVEVISNTPFDQYCNENIFDLLCMDRTSWFLSGFDDTLSIARPHYYQGGDYIPVAHYGFPDYPDGLLRTSAEDIANYMLAYLGDGEFYDRQLLQSATIDSALTISLPNGQGLIWYEEVLFHDGGDAYVWGHNGGETGASTDLYLDPATGIGVAALSNGEGYTIEVCDILYNFALNLNAGGITPADCQTTTYTTQINPVDWSLFPNPSNGTVFLESSELIDGQGVIRIYDAQGRTCFSQAFELTSRVELQLRHLPAGWYQVEVSDTDRTFSSRMPLILVPNR